MAFFDDLSKKVGDAAKTAAKKSGDLVETTKINLAVSSNEDKIKAIETEIGKMLYSFYANGREIPEELTQKCLDIKAIEEEIASLKAKIVQLKNMKICPNCKNEVEDGVGFCPKCGTKLS